jgi:hypothetical protein
VVKGLFEGGDETFTSDLEVFGGLDVDGVGARMAAELRVEMGLVDEVREDGFDGGSVSVHGVVEGVVGSDRITKRKVVQVPTVAVVVEMRVVTADGLVVEPGIFAELVESRL